jgi:hypothetical protein
VNVVLFGGRREFLERANSGCVLRVGVVVFGVVLGEFLLAIPGDLTFGLGIGPFEGDRRGFRG